MSEVTRRILFSCAAIGTVICLILSAATIAVAAFVLVN